MPPFSREKLFGRLRGEFSESVIIEMFVGADDKNSSVNIIQVIIIINKRNAIHCKLQFPPPLLIDNLKMISS